MNKIIIESASKTFGNTSIFKDINLTLESGKIYGLVGFNGSGKTVLMKCICGLEVLSSGSIYYNKLKIGRDIEFMPQTGLIIETPHFIEQFTGFQNLKLLSLIEQKIQDEDIIEVMKSVKLDPHSKKKVKHYSLGMKQKLAIAQAIMEDPHVLLLDEPTNAIDQGSLEEILSLIYNFKTNNRIVLISSHLHSEVGNLYDEIINMENYSQVAIH